MEFGCGSFVEVERAFSLFLLHLSFFFFLIIVLNQPHIFFYAPVTLPQPENSRASTSISSIAKMRSSSCH